ncbi:putative peroxisomal membrane protein PXMP2 4 family protein [Teratosphaeria destructans]|uniref:Peroxisomal membrane protein PXMP2 4 family protein n=1 Tax=Teratosphaeria destructans TaxID=418781 RepID=A0A9W7W769_9PEZI|nr:putative peroxisomal membrane protein PXMP2 4 family protein [Teratosphaeria destructans]
MIFLFPGLAGRSTIRRLQERVHRSIVRRHQARYECGKTNGSPSTDAKAPKPPPPGSTYRTIPGPAWAWIEPLAKPLRGYGNMQKRSPLLTQWESSLVIYYLGDLSAQTMQTSGFREGDYEPARGLRAMLIGGLSSIPSYKWFLFLGDHFNYKSHVLSLAIKIGINQSVFTPIFNTYFFSMQSLFARETWMDLAEAKKRVIETVPTSVKNSWRVWPIVTAFSFTFIPPQSRNVFAGVIAVFWQTYLSWLNKQAEQAEGLGRQADHGEVEEREKRGLEGKCASVAAKS